MDLTMINLESNFDELSEFEWQDVYHAIKQFENIRTKNKIPSFTFEGKTRLKIDVSITSAKHIHVKWRR